MKPPDRRSAFIAAAAILTGSTSSWMIFNAGVTAALAAVDGLRSGPLLSRARRTIVAKCDD